jgi:CRISPR/Cas system-associated exonuclease Cas4 (RecB family)
MNSAMGKDPTESPAKGPASGHTNIPSHSLGDPVQPASGMLVLNASKLKDFATCPRRYFLGSVLKLARADTDEGGRAQLGSAVHAELFARHEDMHTHDNSEPVDGSLGLTQTAMSMVRRHLELCPSRPKHEESEETAHYLGGERDLHWLIIRRALLITGRIDALWRLRDGTIEVRDYKTGACPDSLAEDIGAQIYLLLAANLPERPTKIRVTYESLGRDEAQTVSIEATRSNLAQALRLVTDHAEHIRKERTFPAYPSVMACGTCPYAHLCPAAHRSNE